MSEINTLNQNYRIETKFISHIFIDFFLLNLDLRRGSRLNNDSIHLFNYIYTLINTRKYKIFIISNENQVSIINKLTETYITLTNNKKIPVITLFSGIYGSNTPQNTVYNCNNNSKITDLSKQYITSEGYDKTTHIWTIIFDNLLNNEFKKHLNNILMINSNNLVKDDYIKSQIYKYISNDLLNTLKTFESNNLILYQGVTNVNTCNIILDQNVYIKLNNQKIQFNTIYHQLMNPQQTYGQQTYGVVNTSQQHNIVVRKADSITFTIQSRNDFTESQINEINQKIKYALR
jgi:hypothetical protein